MNCLRWSLLVWFLMRDRGRRQARLTTLKVVPRSLRPMDFHCPPVGCCTVVVHTCWAHKCLLPLSPASSSLCTLQHSMKGHFTTKMTVSSTLHCIENRDQTPSFGNQASSPSCSHSPAKTASYSMYVHSSASKLQETTYRRTAKVNNNPQQCYLLSNGKSTPVRQS